MLFELSNYTFQLPEFLVAPLFAVLLATERFPFFTCLQFVNVIVTV